ncbi:MAG: helix-turn-helix transcriptional regulator [Betaproteobacteria bacterium]|nr:helix-turn-helix transcriptional regulator [Betaproteobacteria bacterium]
MRVINHPPKKSMTLTGILYALSDPVRLSIVKELATHGESPCGAFCLTVAKSTVSHHLRVLREAGVIRMRSEKTQYINTLRREELDSCFPGLLDAILRASPTVRAGR